MRGTGLKGNIGTVSSLPTRLPRSVADMPQRKFVYWSLKLVGQKEALGLYDTLTGEVMWCCKLSPRWEGIVGVGKTCAEYPSGDLSPSQRRGSRILVPHASAFLFLNSSIFFHT